uniref:hypothetical protein n=1 Tax=Escherichia coli TaxID=562 RepID=UPI001F288489|nr:hypothetical protein [Escherichia coli]
MNRQDVSRLPARARWNTVYQFRPTDFAAGETLNTLILNRCIFDIRVTFWFPAFLIGYVMINAPSPGIKIIRAQG